MALRTPIGFAKRSLKIGLLPADGIGREVLPVNTVTTTAYLYSPIDVDLRRRATLYWL